MAAAVRAVRAVVIVPISADTQRSRGRRRGAARRGGDHQRRQRAARRPGDGGGGARRRRRHPHGAARPGPSTRSAAGHDHGAAATVPDAGARGTHRDRAASSSIPGSASFAAPPCRGTSSTAWCCASSARLRRLGRPLLVGMSRKSFIGKLTGRDDPAERLYGSLAATAIAVYNGAALIRTHDVAATRDAVRVAEQLRSAVSSAE